MLRREIEAKAEAFLRQHKSLRPPIDVEKLALAEGIVVARNEFSGNESGFALSQGETRIIGVNSSTHPRRQRFTIAHELGHLLLHHKPLIVDHSILVSRRNEISALGTDQEEIEANAFAAALLMPADAVERELSNAMKRIRDFDRDRAVQKLASVFDVSTDAMGYRLVNLNLITGWI
ncbi:ImmA/IrrE family metallo-endopeptidase [Symbioplanes lichenis]|uniref:ImmA/IrrE family metallo-endopeptidase n=1 Tax=Symbioplanes lichenis TaxID=1629072 RepID=UPI0027395290|nr:ImmA/IrrE family metallo-endopeptidase [Actinoplanes lichenis]